MPFKVSITFYRRAVYGRNTIYVPVRPILELLMLEVINPFYIFQVVSILIWIAIWYYFYAAAIAVMSIAGIIITITQTRRVINNCMLV